MMRRTYACDIMDTSLEYVAELCSEQMTSYMACVEKYPGTWNSSCDALRQQVAKCTQQNPVIENIRVNCAASYEKYEKCLDKNPSAVERCMQQLEDFADCADRYKDLPTKKS